MWFNRYTVCSIHICSFQCTKWVRRCKKYESIICYWRKTNKRTICWMNIGHKRLINSINHAAGLLSKLIAATKTNLYSPTAIAFSIFNWAFLMNNFNKSAGFMDILKLCIAQQMSTFFFITLIAAKWFVQFSFLLKANSFKVNHRYHLGSRQHKVNLTNWITVKCPFITL